jgi:hypothetical protein
MQHLTHVLEEPEVPGVGNECRLAVGQFLRYVAAHPADAFIIFTLPECTFILISSRGMGQRPARVMS